MLAANGSMRLYLWAEMPPPHRLRGFLLTAPIYNAADVTLTVVLGALFALLAWLLPRRSATVARVWTWLAGALAVLAGINVTAVFWLRGPVTFQWLYYADLFRSFTSQEVIASVVSMRAVALVVAALAIFLVVRLVASRALDLAAARGRAQAALTGIGTVLALAAGYAATRPPPMERFRGTYANPATEFVASAWASARNRLPGHVDPDASDYRIGAQPTELPDVHRRPRNVVLIVMESVGSAAVLGPDAPPLPAIRALQHHGLTFTQAYAPTASSTRSNFALLAARYPRFSYRPETYSVDPRPLILLPQRLKQAGYDTAFVMAGDFAFQGVDAFLKNKGFDRMADLNAIPCARRIHSHSDRWQHADRVSDACATNTLLGWIGQPRAKPFFAMLWSIDTHFPYAAPAPASAKPRARYLAALAGLDRQIGRVIAAVTATGKLDDTLFVLVGDHGEAFEQHGNFSHGSTVYEEETHVPLILSNPQLFAGGSDARLASLIDIAPTVLALDGLPAEPSWEGLDLTGLARRRRLYLFAVQRDFIAGYREGPFKVVDNLRYGTIARYDLRRDPGEQHPVSLRGAAAAAAGARIAGWARYQDRLYPGR